jgi:hypothetical protein
LGALAHNEYSDLVNACPTRTNCAPSLAPEDARYHLTSGAFVTSLLGAGVLLGAGLGLFLKAPAVKSPAGASVVPRLGAGYVGLEGGF